ncbi:hypothetical protein [Massilia sp. H6]|uniref:hypothetical protein n=1 Tax=Massilia sp. H6 TaxID=2970464 RepID=UPI002167662F|nr:hypothetical protein [Massilia sp. H6]UVW27046.1 hypothetical protein NRS07_10725 [Massilia sp. H6]
MRKLLYWAGQYLLATGSMFALLVAIDVLIRGEAFETGARQSLAWAVLASAIFIGSRYYQCHKGSADARCGGTAGKR